ncbi:hypothetical protein c7_L218 [Megavirus courdo7]|uniref:Uncharacterized protein n=1 Tax=Megavirus courdo7 TaxID=1128135 RepID=H2EA61_9VIRU|nr:hypothetical protein c7_L218 [Megavirus courdo7]
MKNITNIILPKFNLRDIINFIKIIFNEINFHSCEISP